RTGQPAARVAEVGQSPGRVVAELGSGDVLGLQQVGVAADLVSLGSLGSALDT
ncbi:MAG: hypothetical protein GY832_25125, partial [Chloroflexi bacterium]|nr:hypothetical protein [Chloroflexota bacterium]